MAVSAVYRQTGCHPSKVIFPDRQTVSAVTFLYQVSLVHKLNYLEPEIHSVFSAASVISENTGFAVAGSSQLSWKYILFFPCDIGSVGLS